VLRRAAIPIALAAIIPSGCRRDEKPAPPPAAPIVQPAPPTTAAVGPSFPNSPEGAARRFMYAWAANNPQLLRDSIEPDERYNVLFSAPWVDATNRATILHRLPSEPVKEFKPGDDYPVGPPGGPKEFKTVPSGALGDDLKLVMIMERGMFVKRDAGQWRVMAGDIIDEIADIYSKMPTTQAELPRYIDPRVYVDPSRSAPPSNPPSKP